MMASSRLVDIPLGTVIALSRSTPPSTSTVVIPREAPITRSARRKAERMYLSSIRAAKIIVGEDPATSFAYPHVMSRTSHANFAFLALAVARPTGPKNMLGEEVTNMSTDPRSEEHTSELQSRQYLVC